MLNRRKAMIGWLVYTAAKPIVARFVKSKAKSAVPAGKGSRSRLPKVAGVLAAIGATVGAIAFWRSRSGGEDSPGEGSPGEGSPGEGSPSEGSPGEG